VEGCPVKVTALMATRSFQAPEKAKESGEMLHISNLEHGFHDS
jgi:hypothetical protein